MPIIKLDNQFSYGPQIMPEDIEDMAADGFKTIINNRPDFEQAGQPLSADIATACAACGVDYHHIPVVPGKATMAHVEAFAKAMKAAQGPVLAFCKSGMRAKGLHGAASQMRF